MIHLARLLCLIVFCAIVSPDVWAQSASNAERIFARENLVAWCIVPFDSRKRGPEMRAEMLSRLGITMFAYDWRAEHVPTFDEEIETLKRYGITLQAFWFPGALNDDARAILDALKRHDVKTELWITMNGGNIDCTPEEHADRLRSHAAAIRPLVEAAAAQGCKVGLYNHGGWFGEPRNQIDILLALRDEGFDNVGLVYNQHHGHAHVGEFEALLKDMIPYLYCLNLNGMEPKGDQVGRKIWPLGSGSLDAKLLAIIAKSGYDGPIGILNHHTDRDAELVLRENIEGLEWIVPQLNGQSPDSPRPPLRSIRTSEARGVPSIDASFGRAMEGGAVYDGDAAYRSPPLTVECRAKLHSSDHYNILLANDTKASGDHWEIFSDNGSGKLTVYMPGARPDHVRSDCVITDGQWYHVAMHYAEDYAELFVDGESVAKQSFTRSDKASVPGGFAIGRLVEGVFFCDGPIDDVHIRRGIHPVNLHSKPAEKIDDTIRLWSFDDLPEETVSLNEDVEDPLRRAALPQYQVIPAANPHERTPASPLPHAAFHRWTRSNGDAWNTRYSASASITPENVHKLKQAWVYRSGDGTGDVQCNGIMVDGIFIAPTAGGAIVGLNAATGELIWRRKLGRKPARRGLTYWKSGNTAERVFVPVRDFVYALSPKTGEPISEFGEDGKIAPGESVVAPAIFEDILIVPGYVKDVHAFSARDGKPLWTFDTMPTTGYGADTWEGRNQGANCWGGVAVDDARGIVVFSTGSPKPNFTGDIHRGLNLFANCVVALDARTGERLWHFQEIRHDIWDLDIPAAPNLVRLDKDGKAIDAVAQVTKLGNTLLLDRVTGKPLFPFRLRRAPVSPLPGERTWPYQPDVELPEPFARSAFTRADVTNRNEEARDHIMKRLKTANVGWFTAFEENKATALFGIHGGAEWTGAAHDPINGRLYVSANNVPWLITVFRPEPNPGDTQQPPTPGRAVYEEHCMECHGPKRYGVAMTPPLHRIRERLPEQDFRNLIRTGRNAMPAAAETMTGEHLDALVEYLYLKGVDESTIQSNASSSRYTFGGFARLLDHDGYPGCTPPWGTLNCIDLASGRIVWQRPLGVYPDLEWMGMDDTGAENFGGPAVTAGGVVFVAGTPDERLRAFDAETGDELWQHDLPFGGYAPPSIYEHNGKTYVVIAATGGGKLRTEPGDAYVAFALDR